MRKLLLLITAVVLIGLFLQGLVQPEIELAKGTAIPAVSDAFAREKAAEFISSKAQILDSIDIAISQKNYTGAETKIAEYSGWLDDVDLDSRKLKVKAIMARDRLANIPNSDYYARIAALSDIVAFDSSDKKSRQEMNRLTDERSKRMEAEERKVKTAIRAAKKKEGVTIGMTEQDVLDSRWGKPQSINRSTYSFGVHEQWVYGGHNYLYFENGILTAVQN